MKTRLSLLAVFLFAAILLFAYTASAAIPHLMNFQGKATDKAGAPLSGTHNLTFRIYDAETGGTAKWSETQTGVQITNGIFQVQLGSVTALTLSFDVPYWISLEINTDGEMSPRTRLASVPYAYNAEKAQQADLASLAPVPLYIQGFELEYASPKHIKVSVGCADIAGRILVTKNNSSPIDISDNANYMSDHNSSNPWIYVYLYNKNNIVSYILSDVAPDKSDSDGNSDGVKRYFIQGATPYRCIGAVKKDASGNVVKFFQAGNIVMWDVPPTITTTASLGAWSAALSCSAGIPAISTLGIFGIANHSDGVSNGHHAVGIKPNGSTGIAVTHMGAGAAAGVSMYANSNTSASGIGGEIISFTDSTQQIQHCEINNNNSSDCFALIVKGYNINR